jgi:hypothetical protein
MSIGDALRSLLADLAAFFGSIVDGWQEVLAGAVLVLVIVAKLAAKVFKK